MARRRRGWALRAALVALLVVAAAAVWQWATWPDVASLVHRAPKTTAFIESWQESQRAGGRSDRVAWRPVPLARVAPALRLAVIVAEDIDFFTHHGFAVGEIKAALNEAWEERELPRGASTISQQLAKNLWLSPSRLPWRKAKEALLTRSLERQLSKRRILELYLNVVELGPGVYGAEAAARHWFGKSAAALSDHEAAELAASLPRPSTWHPGSESRSYQRRVAIVERRMARAGGWLRPLVE